MLGVQRNDDARELGTLRLVDRQDIGQSNFIQIAKIVFHLPPLKIDDHYLFDAVNGLDHAQIAVENIPIIVVFGLNYPVPKAKRPAKPLDFWALPVLGANWTGDRVWSPAFRRNCRGNAA